MEHDLISAKTRKEFREYFVGTTLREIEDAFDAADIDADLDFDPQTSGQRRTLVEQYYHSIRFDDPADVRKVLKVYEDVLLELQTQMEGAWNPEYARDSFAKLSRFLKRDGFEFVNGRLVQLGESVGTQELSTVAERLSVPVLQTQIERIRNSIDADPALAVGTAKELVETTCKTILEIREIDYGKSDDLDVLVKSVRKELRLLPEDIPNEAKGVDSIRRILSGLATVTKGLGEIRNLYGTGHGHHGKAKGVSSRHAKLAVGAATTLALFLWETHEVRGDN